jgi:hypothetical protein
MVSDGSPFCGPDSFQMSDMRDRHAETPRKSKGSSGERSTGRHSQVDALGHAKSDFVARFKWPRSSAALD